MDRVCKLNPKFRYFKYIYDRVVRGDVRFLWSLPAPASNYVSTAMVDHSIYNGHCDVVKWLCSRKMYPSIHGVKFAATQGHLEILQFLYSLGMNLEEFPGVMNEVAANGHLEVLKFLYAHELDFECTEEGVDAARANGHSDVVEYIYSISSSSGPPQCQL